MPVVATGIPGSWRAHLTWFGVGLSSALSSSHAANPTCAESDYCLPRFPDLLDAGFRFALILAPTLVLLGHKKNIIV